MLLQKTPTTSKKIQNLTGFSPPAVQRLYDHDIELLDIYNNDVKNFAKKLYEVGVEKPVEEDFADPSMEDERKY